MFSKAKAKIESLIATATPAHATKGKAKAAVGYAAGNATYGEWAKAQRASLRILIALGETFDKYLRPAGAPVFPKDAPLLQGNCGLVAMCMFTSKPYADVAPILGRGQRAGWEGGTFIHQYLPCAAELGFNAAVVPVQNVTLGQFAATTAGKPETHFITVMGHAVAVWDGLIFDQNYPAGALPSEHFTAHLHIRYHMVRA